MSIRLKHRWSVSNNYLAGITASAWWRLLRDNRFAVDPAYWHRAAFVTLCSIMNLFLHRVEESHYRSAIRCVRITKPPVFILGHWRSGTTYLHYLLAQDTKQFTFANTYQVVNPLTFLSTEKRLTSLFAGLLPKTRPMDNMSQDFTTPQEDEFAPCLSTLISPYPGVSFPRREDDYLRYLSCHDVPRKEVEAWKRAFVDFLKKLTLKNDRALLLKSPAHTARIRILLEMFPNARFVNIHRDPYTVFQSHRHYFDTATWYTYMQVPEVDRIEERILRRYRVLYDAYFEDVDRIPRGQFHQLRFEDLERNSVGEIGKLYRALDLPDFDRPKLQAYVDSLNGYKKNKFAPIEPHWKRRVADEWSRSFEAWGYPK